MGVSRQNKYIKSRTNILGLICALIIIIILCGMAAYYYDLNGNAFASNLVLSIGSGLLTGVIILAYGNGRSNLKENAKVTYRKLKDINTMNKFNQSNLETELDAAEDKSCEFILYDNYYGFVRSIQSTLNNIDDALSKAIVPQKPEIFKILYRKANLMVEMLSYLNADVEMRSDYIPYNENGSRDNFEEIAKREFYLVKNNDGSDITDEQIDSWEISMNEISQLIDLWNKTYEEIVKELEDMMEYYSISII